MLQCSTLAFSYLIRIISEKFRSTNERLCRLKWHCTARQKDNESDEVSWREFLQVVIAGE